MKSTHYYGHYPFLFVYSIILQNEVFLDNLKHQTVHSDKHLIDNRWTYWLMEKKILQLLLTTNDEQSFI